MTLTLGEGSATAIRDVLALGGDGRNVLLYSNDLSNAAWDTAGTGSVSVTAAAGYKAGTNRSARITDTGSDFVLSQDIGDDGDYADSVITASAWLRPVSGCTKLTLHLRTEAGSYSAKAVHSAPTSGKWEHVEVTLITAYVADKLQLVITNEDGQAPGAVYDVQDVQVEVAEKASAYVPTGDGSTPLQTRLDAIAAEYADGIEPQAPAAWHLGEYALNAIPVWPAGYILTNSVQANARGIAAAGSGSVDAVASVVIGVMDKAQPSNAAALRQGLYRQIRAIYEVLMDEQATGGPGSWSIAGGPQRLVYPSSMISGSTMFADARIELQMSSREAR